MIRAARAGFWLLLCLAGTLGLRKSKTSETVEAPPEEAAPLNEYDGPWDPLPVKGEDMSVQFIRRRRRRRYVAVPTLPPPTPAPPPTCAYDSLWVEEANECCHVDVMGSWAFTRSIASSETMTISWGFFAQYEGYDLDVAYETSMKSARASFTYMGFGGGADYSGYTADLVVSQTYINIEVNFNMTWTATWRMEDGRYLYQWAWESLFGPSQACQQANRIKVLTSKIVQTDIMPQCLPGANLDPQYTQCIPGTGSR